MSSGVRGRPITRQMTSSQPTARQRPVARAKRSAKSHRSSGTGRKRKFVTHTPTDPVEISAESPSAQSDASSSLDVEVSVREEGLFQFQHLLSCNSMLFICLCV